MLEKAATIKRFEYSPLGSELKKQTDLVKKQYQRLGNAVEYDKEEPTAIKKEGPTTIKKEPDLRYYSKYMFSDY